MAPLPNSIIDTTLNEEEWCIIISEILESEHENAAERPVIFRVPDSLVAVKPAAYFPQVFALGPYHHMRPECLEKEGYKLAKAKKANKDFQLGGLQPLIEEIEIKLAPSIRSCYRGHLALHNKTLALIMIIDSLFLLWLLKLVAENKETHDSSSIIPSQFVDTSGKRLSGNYILRDVLMLENQIPIFVLKEILAQSSSNSINSFEDRLSTMLLKFSEEICPFKLKWTYSSSEVLKHHHMLDLLYESITFKADCEEPKLGLALSNKTDDFETLPDQEPKSNAISKLWDGLSTFNVEFMKIIKKVVDLFINILATFGVSSLAFFNEKKVMIPSVSELCSAYVRFCPTEGGTKFITFNEKTIKFYLPVITLKPTSEVVIKNLVAYETMNHSESFNFKRYTELMSAIVDTIEDVLLLKKAKVLESDLSDAETVEIFNSMTKSFESKDNIIDEAIKKVNKYYYNTRKVKAYRLMKKYIYSSWKFLTIFASVLLLLLMGAQTFCDIYSCPSLLHRTEDA